MEPVAFEVAGVQYRCGQMTAMQQFHVVRRLAPVIARMQGLDVTGLLKAVGPDGGLTSSDQAVPFVTAIVQAIGEMSDADTEYVVSACMSAVQRAIAPGAGFGPVWNAAAKQPQYADINLMVMLQIVARAMVANLAGFTSALSPKSSGAAPTLR